jgi:hypothetical protein
VPSGSGGEGPARGGGRAADGGRGGGDRLEVEGTDGERRALRERGRCVASGGSTSVCDREGRYFSVRLEMTSRGARLSFSVKKHKRIDGRDDSTWPLIQPSKDSTSVIRGIS